MMNGEKNENAVILYQWYKHKQTSNTNETYKQTNRQYIKSLQCSVSFWPN